MPRSRLLAVVVAVAIFTVAALVFWSPALRPLPPSMAEVVESESNAPSVRSQVPDQERSPHEVVRVVSESALVPPSWARVVGRCFGGSARTPLAGVRVRVHRYLDGGGWPDQTWAGASGADGIFDVPFDSGQGLFEINLGRSDLCERWTTRQGVQPGARVDLGEVSMVPGRLVTGSVVSTGGPLTPHRAWIVANVQGMGLDGMLNPGTGVGCPMEPDGSFELGPLPAGTWQIELRSPLYHLAERVSAQVPESGDVAQVRLAARPLRLVTGCVRGPDGRPVPGATILVAPPGQHFGESGIPSVRSDKEGRFIVSEPAGRPAPAVLLRVLAKGFPVATRMTPVLWGEEVTVNLDAGDTFRLRVTDAHSGAMVRRAQVALQQRSASLALRDSWVDLVADDAGWMVGPHPGDTVTAVAVLADGYVPTLRPVVESSGTWEIQVLPAAKLVVHVVDAVQQPLVGCAVEAIAHAAAPDRLLSPGPPELIRVDPRTYGHKPCVVGRGVTGEGGETSLVGLQGSSVWLRITGPADISPALFGPIALEPGGTGLARIEARTGLSVQGQVGPPSVLKLLRGVRLVQDGGRMDLPAGGRGNDGFELDGDGRFAAVLPAPGGWRPELLAVAHEHVPFALTPRRSYVARMAVATLFPTAVNPRIQVDASALVPGVVEGQIFIDGAPQSGSLCVLRRDTGNDAGGWSETAVTDGNGQFRITNVHSGEHSLLVRIQGADGFLHGEEPERLLVSAGSMTSRTVHMARGRLQVRLMRAGAALARQPARLVASGLASADFALGASDERGEIAVGTLIPCHWQILRPTGQVLGHVRLTTTASDATIVEVAAR